MTRFDAYDPPTLLARTTVGRAMRQRLRSHNIELDPFRPASVINAAFEEWVQDVGQRPFFALINYMDAHQPYGPKDSRPDLSVWQRGSRRTPSDNQILAEAYVRSIRDLDAERGRFFDRVAREPWWQNTLVIITSDHGEAIENGTFDHGLDLSHEEIHVPLILHLPGRVPTGMRIEAPVSTNDVPATVEELTGLPSNEFPGHSLLRFVRAPVEPVNPEPAGVLSEVVSPRGGDMLRSVVFGDHQYIRNVRAALSQHERLLAGSAANGR